MNFVQAVKRTTLVYDISPLFRNIYLICVLPMCESVSGTYVYQGVKSKFVYRQPYASRSQTDIDYQLI